MAPEAWKGDKNTILLDVYAMGIVFYELATLTHPFSLRTSDLQQWKDAHLLQSVEPPHKANKSIPLGISQMIMKMVEKNSATRAKDWTEVKRLLDVATQAGTAKNPLIADMMKKRIEADATAELARLKKTKLEQDEQDFGKLVISQVLSVVVNPMQEIFDQFNAQYAGQPIDTNLRQSDYEMTYYIEFPNGSRGTIGFKALLESNYWRDIQFEDHGRVLKRRTMAIPKLIGQKIQGFGAIQLAQGRGFNIVLIEQPDELYGNWFMLLNRDSPWSSSPTKPNPFPFGLDEIENELRYVGVHGHKYFLEVKSLDLEFIQSFITDAIA